MRTNRALVDLEQLPALFPHRIARAAELISLGLSSTAVYARCRYGGPWQRPLPGIVLLSDAPPSRAQRVQAALRYAGPGALVTGHDALQLHGMRSARPGGPVHLLIPGRRQIRSAPTVVVERTTRVPEPLLRNGFPIVPLDRAVLDSTRRMTEPDGVRALIAEVLRRGRLDPHRLERELARGSSRGTALVRQVLAEAVAGAPSVTGARARRLVLRSALPAPQWNVRLSNLDGSPLTVADAWWDDVGMAWEIGSEQERPVPQDQPTTSRRGERLTAAGITVVRTPPARLRDQPAAVLVELTQAYLCSTHRPRPRIRTG